MPAFHFPAICAIGLGVGARIAPLFISAKGPFHNQQVRKIVKLPTPRLANRMLLANFAANFLAVFVVQTIIFMVDQPLEAATLAKLRHIDAVFLPLAFLIPTVLTLIYERPIRQTLSRIAAGRAVSATLNESAQRRLLNEPFVLMLMDAVLWLLATLIYSLSIWIDTQNIALMHRSIYTGIGTGLTTITVAFFLLEHVLQKQLAPVLFPTGRLYAVPGVIHIRISTRLGAMFMACAVIPLLSLAYLVYRLSAGPIEQLFLAVMINALLFLIIGAIVTLLVIRNLDAPIRDIIAGLKSIKVGRFDRPVTVTSNDALGYTGDIINEMMAGLRERDHLRNALALADEVQRNLLPAEAPVTMGLDIAGSCRYCEQTGGDYYDFIPDGPPAEGRVGIIVGDVADHGIASALLMTTGRALLRQRTTLSGSLDRIVADVNNELSADLDTSGRFMTLFYGHLDRPANTITWVNAGHDPALLYAPEGDQFVELGGHHLPLGAFANSRYTASQAEMKAGHILLVGTDGIWEAVNARGEMFGKDRFKKVVRRHRRGSAQEITASVMAALKAFCQDVAPADDITLVVAKALPIGKG
jgi:sigma-B regulation protein RsbU (phosphoserine phosphatase)